MALRPGRLLFTLIALFTITGPYIADWNTTHVYNPSWPPHAKFHNGQTMSMGLYLGLAMLYYLYKPLSLPKHIQPPSSSPPKTSNSQTYGEGMKKGDVEVLREAEKGNLMVVTVLAAMYWVTQLSAILYPGSRAMDPEFGDGFPQLWIDMGCFAVIAWGNWLERGRIGGL
ncbi:hypothetical protein HYALB_00011784 [Hymenoscyphus albidus]|uniref:Uncharacterized protein n=1 Tax=Hymenoscyphus albidus TaxID=595503 RepID=A0A9N9Q5B0_9HELO|nr:hypothetical protein HYALB_00011784 [Hymenoscyphus albidus]